MSEWLDLMLDEVARKRREREEAMAELERRSGTAGKPSTAEKTPDEAAQSGESSPEGK